MDQSNRSVSSSKWTLNNPPCSSKRAAKCVCTRVCYRSSSCNLWLFSWRISFTGKSAEPNMYIWTDGQFTQGAVYVHKWSKKQAKGKKSCCSYRALRAVLHVVHGQFDLRQVVDVGVLEEGDAAEEHGVTGALWRETGYTKQAILTTILFLSYF